MHSYQVTSYGAPLERAEGSEPTPRGTEVLLRVKACGVCHSDLHYWQGGYDLGDGKMFTLQERGVQLPIVLGHEPLGEVVALGPEAEGVRVGDTRLVFPWVGCGACPRCEAGRDIDCNRMRTIGLFQPGGYASHVLVPHARYLFDTTGIPDAIACTLACAGVTALTALKKTGPLYPDDTVVIIGAGGVGLTAVGLAGSVLDRPVVVVDKDEAKLAAAGLSGASHLIDNRQPGAQTRIRDLCGEGAGAVLDFVGTPETLHLGLDLLRRGGRLVAVGLFGGATRVTLPQFALRHISIVGSLTGTLADMPEVLECARNTLVAPVPIEVRPLEEANRTLNQLRAGGIVGRVVLEP